MTSKCIIMVLLSIVLCGCTEKEIKCTDAGEFVSSTMVPTSFNELVKCTVTTTKGTFVVRRPVSAFRGERVLINAQETRLWIGKHWYKICR